MGVEDFNLNFDDDQSVKFFIANLTELKYVEKIIQDAYESSKKEFADYNSKTFSMKLQVSGFSKIEEIISKQNQLNNLDNEIARVKNELEKSDKVIQVFKTNNDVLLQKTNELNILNSKIEELTSVLDLCSKNTKIFPERFSKLTDEYFNYLVKLDGIVNLIFETLNEKDLCDQIKFEESPDDKVQNILKKLSSKLEILSFY
jgi:chaperonin cofactor prefoldin